MGQAGPDSADGDEDRVELPWKPTKNALQGLWDPGPAAGISDIHSYMLGPTVLSLAFPTCSPGRACPA